MRNMHPGELINDLFFTNPYRRSIGQIKYYLPIWFVI
jgi:hypothetical protein